MLSLTEFLIVGGVAFVLIKRHPISDWVKSAKESANAFRGALMDKREREVKEISEANLEKNKSSGEKDAR